MYLGTDVHINKVISRYLTYQYLIQLSNYRISRVTIVFDTAQHVCNYLTHQVFGIISNTQIIFQDRKAVTVTLWYCIH